MKNGLLICSGEGRTKNIGDYIQSIAAEQFFDRIETYVEREALDTFNSKEPVRVIMNGWFMHHPENWPPSVDILPFFISFHIVPNVAEKMLSEKGVKYLKKFAPIGCRDYGTLRLLQSKGISAYFSGCLTLTLRRDYFFTKSQNRIIFVDPYYESGLRRRKDFYRLDRIIIDLFYLVRNLKKVFRLSKIMTYEFRSGYSYISSKFEKMVQASSFYRAYSKMFDDEVLFNAQYISHSIIQSNFKSDTEKMDYAKNLLKLYAESSLVVTSRIHCALPCLALETPVIFVTSDNLEGDKPLRSPGRFDGIIELFHVVRYTPKAIQPYRKTLLSNDKISQDIQLENKNDYLEIREVLSNKCREFVTETDMRYLST